METAEKQIKELETNKTLMENELQEIKVDNAALQKESTERANNEMTPESYLDMLAEEKDLAGMAHFCQLVNAKYN